jgi:hypothetical protein
MLYNSLPNFFSLFKYTFIRFVTSHSKGSPIGWSGGGKGGAALSGRVPLNKRAVLGRGSAF